MRRRRTRRRTYRSRRGIQGYIDSLLKKIEAIPKALIAIALPSPTALLGAVLPSLMPDLGAPAAYLPLSICVLLSLILAERLDTPDDIMLFMPPASALTYVGLLEALETLEILKNLPG